MGLLLSSNKIRCMNIEGQIPLISAREQPITPLWGRSTLNNFSSSIIEREEEIITNKVDESPR